METWEISETREAGPLLRHPVQLGATGNRALHLYGSPDQEASSTNAGISHALIGVDTMLIMVDSRGKDDTTDRANTLLMDLGFQCSYSTRQRAGPCDDVSLRNTMNDAILTSYLAAAS